MDQLVIDGVRRDIATLRADVVAWIDRRTGAGPLADTYAAHFSQLCAARAWFAALLDHFAAELAARPDRERARRIRGPLFGLFKLWDRVRDRLQQREAAADVRVWQAADDVAYACCEPTLARARQWFGEQRFSPRPPPLPFMSPEWGARPVAFDAGDLPREFADALSGEALRRFRLSWPLPTVMLPATYAASPWWLVLLGHEIGHAVHFELGLRGPLARALAGAGGSSRWADWSSEVFADAYSVCMMGRAAVLALLVHVLDDAPRMQDSADPRNYPPPAIRLELMRRLAVRLGAADEPLPVDLPALLRGGAAARELPVLDAVVAALAGPLPDLDVGLAALCGHGEPLPLIARPRAAIAGMFLEYAGGAPDLDVLRERTLAALDGVAPGGSRGLAECPGDGPALAELLIAGTWDDAPPRRADPR